MNAASSSLKRILTAIIAMAVLLPLLLIGGADFFSTSLSGSELDVVSESVRRAAVQCYALEGFYPTEIDYLYTKYGVSDGGGRYFIDYQFIASNLMPDITVIPVAE